MVRTILGISPGTRRVGFAVMRNGELIDCRIKTFKERWSRKKRSRIVFFAKDLFDAYQITDVALRKLEEVRTSKQLKSVSNRIIRVAKSKRIRVHGYSMATVKLGFGIARVNKKGLMEHIANLYPELRRIYLKQINSTYPHYEKTFEAIAIVKWCQLEQEL